MGDSEDLSSRRNPLQGSVEARAGERPATGQVAELVDALLLTDRKEIETPNCHGEILYRAGSNPVLSNGSLI